MSPDDIATDTLLGIQRLYGAQSHLIDEGRAAEWAATFTADGEFRSPSYPEPAAGARELTAFAERFHASARAAGLVTRHVLTNLWVESADDHRARVRAYLQIVSTPAGGPSRLERMTVVTDDLVRAGGRWLVRRRTVHRDDAPPDDAGDAPRGGPGRRQHDEHEENA
ncbi:nuclear transport factor 2 family protein [Actinomadura miaoliensis]|uniref:SnoaL-like domain-containing protein n=1 Tax=Actinomadura miaoliensis TaxID=430685 RepID=A0ABP7VCN6_9ACTN